MLCEVDEPTVRRLLSSALAKLGADDLTDALSIALAPGHHPLSRFSRQWSLRACSPVPRSSQSSQSIPVSSR